MRQNLLIIFILLLIKLVYFQYACLFADSFGHGVLEMLLLILPKISVSIFILCGLLCLGRGGVSVLLVLLDMWLGANMIYYACNTLFIDVPAIMMIGNLTDSGTTNAIIPHLKDLSVLPLSSFFIFTLMPGAKEEIANKRKFLSVIGGVKY